MNKGLSVLLVDDDTLFGDMFREALLDENIKTDYVNNGYDGISQVRSGHYDILFLDVVMPGIDGILTLKKIREFNKEIEVVIITGFAINDAVMDAYKYGVFKAVNKPVRISEIMDIIGELAKKKKKAR